MGNFKDFPNWKWSLEPKDDFVADFLVPALTRARRYDRLAGFFSSSCLLVSAKGIECLVRSVPRSEWPAYRLIVCEQLTEDDVKAIHQGIEIRQLELRLTERLLKALQSPQEAAARDRLGLLAALVAVGFAEIRVAVPKGPDGKPRPGAVEHAKVAILHDHAGNMLVGFGSANETWQGWAHNNEQMDVYASWDETAWQRYGESKVERFDRMWADRDEHTIVIDLPRAVREKLVALAPEELPPEVRPLEAVGGGPCLSQAQEQVLFQFLKDAPYLHGSQHLGMVTACVEPWPHQVTIVDAAVRGDAPRFLFCDEVGLGKTAEAAFAIRQMRLTGRARRVLLLVPRNVLFQWQDELREKFNLHVPVYTGSELIHPVPDSHGAKPRTPAGSSEAFGGSRCMVLATTELVRREDRRDEILSAPEWDLVVIDEAHHARRKGFSRPDEPPNNLLSLALALRDRTRGMLLLTATPMQVDPQELWDLLGLLGLPGLFGRSYNHFRSYYQQLARLLDGPADFNLLCDAAAGSPKDTDLLERLANQDPVLLARLQSALTSIASRQTLRHIDAHQRAVARQFFLAFAPTRQMVFRTTREMLRRYRREGRLKATVPRREVQRLALPLSSEEAGVYESIEDFLSKYYVNAATNNQQGLGFVLTSYRRRLASSMYAVSRSLQRLLDGVERGAVKVKDLLDDEDDIIESAVAVDEEDLPIDEEASGASAAIREIGSILDRIGRLGGKDSKYLRLVELLDELDREHPRVIIFTQYKDTMDYLRLRLVTEKTPRVGSYSGRGAEVYSEDAGAFISVSKDELREAFQKDGGIRYLVCTDAASEGLNLQVCGALVNYDMPWNPMRVEQRIGRIDRIGQAYDTVRVRNMFYLGTVEDDVYEALGQRIDLFEQFIGPLQPILTSVQKAIQKIAMTPRDKREDVKRREIEGITAEAERLKNAAPSQPIASDFARQSDVHEGPLHSPVTLGNIRRVCLRSPTFIEKHCLRLVGPDVYEIRWGNRVERVTFSPEVMDRQAGEYRLLSYGDPVFDQVISGTECPAEVLGQFGLCRTVDPATGSVCYWHEVDGVRRVVPGLSQLMEIVCSGGGD